MMKALSDCQTLNMSQIGKILQLPRPQVTSKVDRLVDLRFVDRKTDPDDRRNVLVFLTSEGSVAFERFDEMIRQGVKESLSTLTEEDVVQLSAALSAMRRILGKFE